MLRTTEKVLRQIAVIVLMVSEPISAEVLDSRQFQVDKTSIPIKKIACKESGTRSIIRISGLNGHFVAF